MDEQPNDNRMTINNQRQQQGIDDDDDDEEQTPRSCWARCCCCCSRRKKRSTPENNALNESTPLLPQSTPPRRNKHAPFTNASPSRTPLRNDNSTTPSVIVLLLDIESRRFELVALQRTTTVTTADHVLQLLPTAVQDEALQNVRVTALADRFGNEWKGNFPLPDVPAWLVVAVTPHVSARQGQVQARKLLQDVHVQATVSLVCARACVFVRTRKCVCGRPSSYYGRYKFQQTNSLTFCARLRQLRTNGVEPTEW